VSETALDLRYNIAAMYIAILRDDIATPEQAFAIISEIPIEKVYGDEDILDMVKMKQQGMYYKDIGQVYGISKDAARRRIERYRKKTNSSGNLKRSMY